MKENKFSIEDKIFMNLELNKEAIGELCENSSDVIMAPFSSAGHSCCAVWCDGMVNMLQSWELLYQQLLSVEKSEARTPEELFNVLTTKNPKLIDTKTCEDFSTLFFCIGAGNIVLLIERCNKAVIIGAQGYSFRAVSESYTEENVRSAREGFAEPLRVNITLVRRRLKTNKLVFDVQKVGKLTNTEVAVTYLSDRVDKKNVASIKKRLSEIDIEMVLESGFIEPFLENNSMSLFSGVGHTERPDSFCGKLREGRIGIIVDGTPFALILPHLFAENFQSFDDYTNKPYYATMIRMLKYLAFAISCFLPGIYVAIVNYTPDILPLQMIINISKAQQGTPLPLMFEALFIHLVYEIVREAGLRLPRPIGHAVSLVGALVVGEAAVNAGIVCSTTVMVIALTAISSFTIPMLYEPISIIRLATIIVGGMFGPFAVSILICALLIDICSIDSYGIPFTAPISPFASTMMSDGIVRLGWRGLSKHSRMLDELPGAKKLEEDENGQTRS
ncbi:MAG: spore germination protein [Oscillospiraceae bacterium]